MRLYSPSLPKLAVLANLVCLIVVFLKTASSVKLYNACSSQNIRVDHKGAVSARDDPYNIFQNLTIKSLDFSGKLTIFGEESQRYLCFKKRVRKPWKLVGSKKFRGSHCIFYEEMVDGYTRYKSALPDGFHYIGFNKRGKFLSETRERELTSAQRKCLNFLKLDTGYSISEHNKIVAGIKDGANVGPKIIIDMEPKMPDRIRHRHNHTQAPMPNQVPVQIPKSRHKTRHHKMNDVT